MDKDLGTLRFSDFDYGHTIPSHLEFLDEGKPSWLKIFDTLFSTKKSAKIRAKKLKFAIRGRQNNCSPNKFKTAEQKRSVYQSLKARITISDNCSPSKEESK